MTVHDLPARLRPRARAGHAWRRRPSSLAGLRIAVLDNGKPNADVVMTAAAEALAARTGATVAARHEEGPPRAVGQRRHPVADDRFELVCAEADIVITGAADCGSCTAYSVFDAIALEKAGKPTVVVTTTKFRTVAETLSRSFGAPRHPAARAAPPDRRHRRRHAGRWAEAATDRLIALFTDPA